VRVWGMDVSKQVVSTAAAHLCGARMPAAGWRFCCVNIVSLQRTCRGALQAC